jgi:hypothetical protein
MPCFAPARVNLSPHDSRIITSSPSKSSRRFSSSLLLLLPSPSPTRSITFALPETPWELFA